MLSIFLKKKANNVICIYLFNYTADKLMQLGEGPMWVIIDSSQKIDKLNDGRCVLESVEM